MNELFEYRDVLKSPIEAFYCDYYKNWKPIQNHWHYFMEILYCTSGAITVTCNENSYVLRKGNFLLIPPQALHSIDTHGNDGFRYACIKFNLSRIQLVEDYLPNLTLLFHKVASTENKALYLNDQNLPEYPIAHTVDLIVQEIAQKNYGYNTYVYSLLSSFMLQVVRYWYHLGISVEKEPATDASTISINNIIQYIDKHSHEAMNVEDLASMCNMSYSYFAKIFNRQYGQSCKQYIEFIRLSKAENLLLFTDRDLSSIASETGFADCSHLIRCFKRRYHITPKQYRLMHASL